MRNFRVFLALAIFFCLISGQARAIDLVNVPELQEIDFPPQGEFEEKTKLFKEIPFDDQYLAFQVRLPKDWTLRVDPPKSVPDGRGLSNRVLGIVAEYASPPRFNLQSLFTLEALELTYEVSARNWFVNYALQNGYTLNAMSERSEKEIEAIYVIVEGDTTYAVRIRAIINGPRVIIARYIVPQEDFNDERLMQAQALRSFKVINMEKMGIENLSSYGFLDQSYFEYPVSWKLDAPTIKSIERMRAMLYTGDDAGKPDGQINMYLTSRLLGTTLANEVQAYRDKIDIPGFKRGRMIERRTFDYDKGMTFGATEVYEMVPQPITMMHYELAVTVMQNDGYHYIVALLSPSRKEEFYKWARNMRAFRIITESIRRYKNEGDEAYFQPVESPPAP